MPRKGLDRDERGVTRCGWAGKEGIYRLYHDREWGMPVRDDPRLFEKVCLEGFQAGLSWLTILTKRENFRRAFADFDFHRVARFDQRKVARLLKDASIVRHRGKIESTIHNAQRARELEKEFGSLANYFWQWEPAPSKRPRKMTHGQLIKLAKTPESTALSRDLKKRGWTYVGPTTIYAFMQAMGLVNDHLEGCAARERVERARRTFKRPKPRS
jgi:DNA-3-methyladenine glycosylase I